MQTLRHVVCGTDFSEHAQHAFELALAISAAAGTRLTLVHVCELGVDHDEPRLRRCEQALARVVASHGHGVRLTGVLRCGSPWQKLDNVAADVGASLIVIGRQGAGRGRSVELGSVASRLVRTASRPVLTVASDFERFASEALGTNPHERNETP